MASGGYHLDLSLSSFLFNYLIPPAPLRNGREANLGRIWVKSEEEKSHMMNYKSYFWVWLGLIILTGTTVSVAGMPLGHWPIVIALAIAGTKSGLVLNYFMHLRSERMLIFKIIIPLVMAVFLVFIILTFADVAFRGGVK